jgi:hypothetical protein
MIFQRLRHPERGWGCIRTSDIDVDAGLNEIPTLEELRLERQANKENDLGTTIRYWLYKHYHRLIGCQVEHDSTQRT